MASVLYKRESQLTLEAMESYFRNKPPDCSLFSEDNLEIKVHKEVLYQTSYMIEMIKSLDIEFGSMPIEIFCPSLTIQELRLMGEFLYNGKLQNLDQISALKMSIDLTELFGFPKISLESNPDQNIEEPQMKIKIPSNDEKSTSEQEFKEPNVKKRSRKQSLNSVRSDIKEEIVWKEETYYSVDESVSNS